MPVLSEDVLNSEDWKFCVYSKLLKNAILFLRGLYSGIRYKPQSVAVFHFYSTKGKTLLI